MVLLLSGLLSLLLLERLLPLPAPACSLIRNVYPLLCGSFGLGASAMYCFYNYSIQLTSQENSYMCHGFDPPPLAPDDGAAHKRAALLECRPSRPSPTQIPS